MNTNIKSILLQFKHGHVGLSQAEREILSLLDENTGRVSDDVAPSGVSHGVRERDASDQSGDLIQSSVDGSLGNRIEAKESGIEIVGEYRIIDGKEKLFRY